MDDRLLGTWAGTFEDEEIEMVFSPDGGLRYSVTSAGGTKVMILTYVAENGVLTTDQESSPRAERTEYRFEPGGDLILVYEGSASRFSRKKEASPPSG